MIEFIGTTLQLQSIKLLTYRTPPGLRLSDECFCRMSHCCLNLGLISTARIYESTAFYNSHEFLCSVNIEMLLLTFVAAGTSFYLAVV
jgi:hypothetical protein